MIWLSVSFTETQKEFDQSKVLLMPPFRCKDLTVQRENTEYNEEKVKNFSDSLPVEVERRQNVLVELALGSESDNSY